ncbi:MAG: hypothetical protein M0020_10005 [Actinomycetota bacterium]|nr:hypothetical protein [Actinomycetota bacterium]
MLKDVVETSGVLKTTRKGDTKVSKLGIAKAVLRPTKTLRTAVGGAVKLARDGSQLPTQATKGDIASEDG